VPTTLTPELRLLTRAALPSSVAASVGPSLDWDRVVAQARRHRLAPLLSRYLEAVPAGVPDEVVARLARDRRRTAAANLRLLAGGRAVIDALADAGVTVVVLKGVALLEETFADISLRPTGDIDLLVHDASIQRAEDVILELGYRSARPAHAGMPDPRPTKYAYPELKSPDGLVHVDLHRHLLPDAAFDIQEVWTHARPSGQGVHLLPDHADLLLHLAAHFFKDRLRRSSGSLGQLADIAWVVDAHTIDWDVVVGRAWAYGLHGRVYLSLMATNELLGPVVPSEVLTALRPSSYSPSVGRAFITRRLLTEAPWHPPGYFGGVPGKAFSRRWRPMRRVLPDRAYLEAAHGRGAGAGSSYARLLWIRARRAVTTLHPWHLYRDARLNRWMRTVADEGTNRTPV